MKRGTFKKKTVDEIKAIQEKRKALGIPPRRQKLTATGSKRVKNTTLHKTATKKHRKPKPKTITQAKLKKTLDSIFSQYIRRKYADENGMVKCYTCPRIFHWKEIQNGHFISRSYLATRFDENNCRPQCVGDNIFGHGRPLDFEENLKKELGSDYVEAMKLKRHLTVKLDRQWYINRIEEYTILLNSL